MPLPSDRDPWVYVEDMLEHAERIVEFAGSLSAEDLLADRMRWDAVLMNLAQLGEAGNRIPEAMKRSVPQVPWRALSGTRNRVIHAYLGVDADIVHDIIHRNLPVLREALRALLLQRPTP
jgi:uncharacterized protein with HEPN domain